MYRWTEGASVTSAMLVALVGCGHDELVDLGGPDVVSATGGGGGAESLPTGGAAGASAGAPGEIGGAGASAGAPGEIGGAGGDCSVEAQKSFVYSVMKSYYLWSDSAPDLWLSDYQSPQAVLAATMYTDLDRWSRLDPVGPRNALYREGMFIGLGYSLAWDTDGSLRVAYVYPDSSAADAGFERGTRFVAVGGYTVAELTEGNLWTSVLGPEQVGVTVTIDVEDPGGGTRQVTLTKQWVVYQTVPVTRVLDTPQGKVGYLILNRFLSTSVDEIRNAFAELSAVPVTDLVVDLRYNPGGLIDVAALLGSLIAGPEHAGQRFVLEKYNDRYQSMDTEILLTDETGSLSLGRLVVITGTATGSASELVINGLIPFMPVGLVGDTTYGKPVGSLTWEFCEQALTPITFSEVNADGDGDYYGGFAPDCVVADDLDTPLGDPNEARLSAALQWLADGTCPATAP
jgi:carboxyl-terminal processing protease